MLSKVVFRVPLHLPKKKIKIQDTNVATSWRGAACDWDWACALRHPPKAIEILGKVLQLCLQPQRALQVTTANNVSERYASSSSNSYRYRYIYTARNYSARNNSLPVGCFSFSLSLYISLSSFSPPLPLHPSLTLCL